MHPGRKRNVKGDRYAIDSRDPRVRWTPCIRRECARGAGANPADRGGAMDRGHQDAGDD